MHFPAELFYSEILPNMPLCDVAHIQFVSRESHRIARARITEVIKKCVHCDDNNPEYTEMAITNSFPGCNGEAPFVAHIRRYEPSVSEGRYAIGSILWRYPELQRDAHAIGANSAIHPTISNNHSPDKFVKYIIDAPNFSWKDQWAYNKQKWIDDPHSWWPILLNHTEVQLYFSPREMYARLECAHMQLGIDMNTLLRIWCNYLYNEWPLSTLLDWIILWSDYNDKLWRDLIEQYRVNGIYPDCMQLREWIAKM